LQRAALRDPRVAVVPLSDIARRYLDALPSVTIDKDAEIVVFCHHGVRSAQVTLWMQSQGWSNVRSMAGGIALRPLSRRSSCIVCTRALMTRLSIER